MDGVGVNPLAGARTVLFVHAHPDDETLATGGLILELTAQGMRVQLLTATRGEQGEVVPALRDRVGSDPDQLTRIRERELEQAVARLGIESAQFLGEPPARAAGLAPRRYRDSGMRWVTPDLAGPAEDVPPDALTAASLMEVAADVAAFLAVDRPDAVVSYDDLGGYGHPDHRHIREATLDACRAAGIRFVEVVPPDAPGAWLVDASPRLGALQHALRAHATQVTVERDEVVHSGGQRQAIQVAVGLRRVR